jgi:hypothetical protein
MNFKAEKMKQKLYLAQQPSASNLHLQNQMYCLREKNLWQIISRVGLLEQML